VVILLPDAGGRLEVRAAYPPNNHIDEMDTSAAKLAWSESRATGRGTKALFTTQHLFLPLRTSHGPIGAVGVSRAGAPLNPGEERLLAALIDQAAVAIERVQLAGEMDSARLATETERLRSALLSSLSHDLKTPLASITGAATSLRQYGGLYDAAAREELAATIQGEAERLSRFVANLLDMTRLKAGGIALKREPTDLGEAVGAALQRMQGVLGEHQVVVDLAAGLPMLDLDVVLFEQVLVNLLDNAAKYSLPGSGIAIAAACDGRQVALTVSDEGPGIPASDLERVFEMFHRVNKGDRQRAGTGLGLSICRGFVEVLGGTIQAANRVDGPGAVFTIKFPESVFTAIPREDAAE
jgi:two-component system sensor histidine kinase KdpD